jgi:hypothetical protein
MATLAFRVREGLRTRKRRIDEFRISHIRHSDGWIETTWNNMTNPGPLPGSGRGAGRRDEPSPSHLRCGASLTYLISRWGLDVGAAAGLQVAALAGTLIPRGMVLLPPNFA